MEDTTTPHSMPVVCHLSSFAGFAIPFGNILGPLGVWIWKRNTDPVMVKHGIEALNFQISMSLYLGVLVVMAIVGMPFLGDFMTNFALKFADSKLFLLFPFMVVAPFILLGLANIFLTIRAAMKAHKGQSVRYPLTIRFIRG